MHFIPSALVIAGIGAVFILLPLYLIANLFISREVSKLLAHDLGTLPVPRSVRIDDSLLQLPAHFLILLVLMEDDMFWTHSGFNIPEIWRSLRFTIKDRRLKGGSSISQQVARGVLARKFRIFKVTRNRVFRKFIELPLTVLIEWRFNKDQILSIYLETIPYFGGICGIQGAARALLHKNASELSIEESFVLIWMISNPANSHHQIISKTRSDTTRIDYCLAYEKLLVLTRIMKFCDLGWLESIKRISVAGFISPHEDAGLEGEFIRQTTKHLYEMTAVVNTLKTNYDRPIRFLHSYLTPELQAALSIFARSDNLLPRYTANMFKLNDLLGIEKIGIQHSIIQLYDAAEDPSQDIEPLYVMSKTAREETSRENAPKLQELELLVADCLSVDSGLIVGGDLMLLANFYGEGQRKLDRVFLLPGSDASLARIEELLNSRYCTASISQGEGRLSYTTLGTNLLVEVIDPNKNKNDLLCSTSPCSSALLSDGTGYRLTSPMQELFFRVGSEKPFSTNQFIELVDIKRLISEGGAEFWKFFDLSGDEARLVNVRLAVTITDLLLGLNYSSEDVGYALLAFLREHERKISDTIANMLRSP
jgi:hypothetical protein